MATTLPTSGSLELLIEFCINAAAALNARAETRHLAVFWRQLLATLKQARDARDLAREAWVEAIAIYNVVRLEWNESLTKLSGVAFQEAGKKASAEPYHGSFGSTTAAKARSLGAARAVQAGSLLLTRLAATNHPALVETTAAFQVAQAALVQAAAGRRQAFEAFLAHSNHRARHVGEAQTAIHNTEADLLKLFPGNRARVRVVLSPPGATERKEARESAPPT
jgi:hypothetical protein